MDDREAVAQVALQPLHHRRIGAFLRSKYVRRAALAQRRILHIGGDHDFDFPPALVHSAAADRHDVSQTAAAQRNRLAARVPQL